MTALVHAALWTWMIGLVPAEIALVAEIHARRTARSTRTTQRDAARLAGTRTVHHSI